ncbi:MAG: hypothetical protein QW568_04360 [Candidatus Anstonellaceae archaeon]
MVLDFFTLENYWVFPVVIAAIYIAITNFAQGNIGGKNRMRELQLQMKDVQKRMTESAKNKREDELNSAISENWKLTMEIMKIQMQMFAILIGALLLLSYIFPLIEPGTQDDVRLQLFDDGLAAHCDAAAGDGKFSNCYTIPSGAKKGAWIVDFYLYSSSGEQLARQGAPLYHEGGKAEDIWLQTASQNGLLDGLLGKVAYSLNVSTGKQNYSSGETVALSAAVSPKINGADAMVTAKPAGDSPSSLPQYGPKLEAVLDSGTFFHVDLPFSIPLLNIRRIIGSYGVFIFAAFVLSIVYSIIRALYAKIKGQAKPAQ